MRFWTDVYVLRGMLVVSFFALYTPFKESALYKLKEYDLILRLKYLDSIK